MTALIALLSRHGGVLIAHRAQALSGVWHGRSRPWTGCAQWSVRLVWPYAVGMASVEVEIADGVTRRQRGLLAIALAGGNAARASEACGVPERTLRTWRVEHAVEFERVRRELAPRLEALAVAELQAFVLQAAQTKLLALEKTHAALEADAIPAKDLPAALKNIATAEAIGVDKAMVLSGRPTQVIEHRSGAELVARLARLGAVVDATAVEDASA